MPSDTGYSRDTEFKKLLSRAERVDLTRVALELARDAYPGLDFHPTLSWIENRAGELAQQTALLKNDVEGLHVLSRCIAVKHGIFGDELCYERAEASYLNRVVETGRGIPISLSLLYMAVGNRLGLSLHAVAAPMHFLVGCETAGGTLFLDAFSRGRILEFQECAQWIGGINGISTEQAAGMLQPASPRTIVIRMLNNLKGVFARAENWNAAWNVQRRLSALEPASYVQRRDLAVIALRSQRPGEAVDLLQSCLRDGPREDRTELKSQVKLARSQLAQWN